MPQRTKKRQTTLETTVLRCCPWCRSTGSVATHAHAALFGAHQTADDFVVRRCEADSIGGGRYGTVDRIDLRAAPGHVIEQHRRARVRDLQSELTYVRDRIAK